MNVAVIAAIFGNVGVAITKFIVAAASGSSAMLTEAVHSVVDTGNGLLLLFGEHRSRRPPDEGHPFGHGKDLYFWSLVVAILIFAGGGGISIYEGVLHLQHPPELGDPKWSYIVLGCSALFEGATLVISIRAFRRSEGRIPLYSAIHGSKDPSTFTVILEDSAALVGLAIAFLGVWLGHVFHNRYLDGIAALAIGVLLGSVAVLLARESHDLLIGEAATPEVLRNIRRLAEADPAVEQVRRPFTMHFGPNTILLTMDVQFRPDLDASELEQVVDRIERAIRTAHPQIKYIYLEAESITRRARSGAPSSRAAAGQ